MALVVEDGSVVTGANTYVSRADYIAYAATVGVTIADTDTADVHLIKAAQYIDQHEENLKGIKTDRDQPMGFPRSGLCIEGWSWSNNEIPRQVTSCQLRFALDVNAGRDLWNRPENPSLVAKRKKVEGAVEVEYAISGNQTQKLSMQSTGDALLSSLLKNNGLMSVQLVRA